MSNNTTYSSSDNTPNSAGSASPPTRLSQPLTGDNFGFHFPLQLGTEVLLACQNGDLNQPVILGTIPNPNQQSPVTNANPSQHILSSAGGHQLLMDDNQDNPRIQLNTPGGHNRLELNAPQGNHSVKLVSEKGDIALKTAKHLSIKAEQNINKTVGGNHTITISGSHAVNAKTGSFNLQSGGNIIQTAEEGPMTLTAGQNLIAQIAGSMNLTTDKGDISVTAEQGGIYGQIGKALNIVGTGQGQIVFKQVNGDKTSSIVFEPDGSIVVNAKNVNIMAKNKVTMTGHNFKHQGPQQVANNPLTIPDCMFPSVDMNLTNAPSFKLISGVMPTGPLIYTYTGSFTGDIKVIKEDACNPLSINQDEIGLEGKQVLGEYLSQTKVILSPKTYAATLNISVSTELVSTTVMTDPNNPNHFILIASPQEIKVHQGIWYINGTIGFRLDVYASPTPPPTSMVDTQNISQSTMQNTSKIVEYGYPLPTNIISQLTPFFEAHQDATLEVDAAGLFVGTIRVLPVIVRFLMIGAVATA